ncbi:MAG: hypothetical protein ACK4N5_18095 [Myxococcales bacterium]
MVAMTAGSAHALTIIRGESGPPCKPDTCRELTRAEHTTFKRLVRSVWRQVKATGRYSLWHGSIDEAEKGKPRQTDVAASVTREAYIETDGVFPIDQVHVNSVFDHGVRQNLTLRWRRSSHVGHESVKVPGGTLDITRHHFGTSDGDAMVRLFWTCDQPPRKGELVAPTSIDLTVSGPEPLVKKELTRLRRLSVRQLFSFE